MRPLRSVVAVGLATAVLGACSAQPDTDPTVAADDPRPVPSTATAIAPTEAGPIETGPPVTAPRGSTTATPDAEPEDAEPGDDASGDAVPSSRVETATGPPRGEVEVGGGAAPGEVEARVGEILAEFDAVEVGADTVLTVPEQVLFDFDSAQLRPDAPAALDALVEVLDFESAAPVEIRGHTDSRGADDYNQGLSEARAEAVRAYFERQGVDPARLRAVGLGETAPVAPNEGPDGSDDPVGRQANRRVEVVVEGAAG